MHPLTRIIIVLYIASISLVFSNLLILISVLFFCLLLLMKQKRSQEETTVLLKRFIIIIPLLFTIFLIQLLFNNTGDKITLWIGLKVSRQGLDAALSVVLRMLIILCSGAWLWRINLRELSHAFRIVKLPESIVVMFLITIRFIPTLSGKVRLYQSQITTRGIVLRKVRYITRLRLYIKLLISIIGRVLKDIRYQAISLDMRGFRNGRKHTEYRLSKLRFVDYLVMLILLIGFGVLLRVY